MQRRVHKTHLQVTKYKIFHYVDSIAESLSRMLILTKPFLSLWGIIIIISRGISRNVAAPKVRCSINSIQNRL